VNYWEKHNKPEGLLWRSPDLELLGKFYQNNISEMKPVEIAFYKTSIEARDSEEREKEEIKRREIEKVDALEKLALMDTVIAEFSHRMNNLAGTVPIRIEIIKENIDTKDPKNVKAIRQLDGITNDVKLLLDAALEIKRSNQSRVPEFININEELEIAIARVWSSNPNADERIRIVRKMTEYLPPLYLERNKFLDTLASMVQNGMDAMPEGGTLSVTTQLNYFEKTKFVAIIVRDTGVGIPARNLHRIFDLFFTTKQEGVGFGLWRDKMFIKKNGGNIEVNSVVGEGTTFTITIPVKSDAIK
jgi:signal transduction histidine kinase